MAANLPAIVLTVNRSCFGAALLQQAKSWLEKIQRIDNLAETLCLLPFQQVQSSACVVVVSDSLECFDGTQFHSANWRTKFHPRAARAGSPNEKWVLLSVDCLLASFSILLAKEKGSCRSTCQSRCCPSTRMLRDGPSPIGRQVCGLLRPPAPFVPLCRWLPLAAIRLPLKMLEGSVMSAAQSCCVSPGVGKCPILGILDITKHSSHYRPLIPNGWVMWKMGTFNDPCSPKIYRDGISQVLRCWANAYLGIDVAEEVPSGVKALAADKELSLDTKVGSADLDCDVLQTSEKTSCDLQSCHDWPSISSAILGILFAFVTLWSFNIAMVEITIFNR